MSEPAPSPAPGCSPPGRPPDAVDGGGPWRPPEQVRAVVDAAARMAAVARRYLPDPGPDETPLGGAALCATATAVRGLESALEPLRLPPGPIAVRGWPPETWHAIQELDTLFDGLLSRWGWRGVAGRRGCEGSPAARRPDIAPGELRRVEALTSRLEELLREETADRDHAPAPAPPPSALDARDRWIYDECCNGTAYKTIRAELERHPEWDELLTVQAVHQAARRYADRNRLPRPPARRRGRRNSTGPR